MWNNQNGEDLEALGGGFNHTLANLQDEDKRRKIAAKLREIADTLDKVLVLLVKGTAACFAKANTKQSSHIQPTSPATQTTLC